MSAEAQRVLRCFATKTSEREGSKPMPSFPDMVAYVQDKVKLSLFVIEDNPVLLKVAVRVLSSWSFQAAQRIKTPAKYIVGTATIPFNPSAFGEVIIFLQLVYSLSVLRFSFYIY